MWFDIEILIQSSEKSYKMRDILNNKIFTMFVDASIATVYIKTNF